MKLVGITGGIGSGKSTVSKVLETMGYAVYDSDKRAKELYFKPNVKIKVIQLLGEHCYHVDGAINKAYIGSKVFSDATVLKSLEAILHPAVKQDFKDWQQLHQNSTMLFKESALIFEKQLDKDLDAVILVTSDEQERIKRIIERDHVSEDEVRKRMSKQWSDEQKAKYTDLIVKNDEFSMILPQIIQILNQLGQVTK
jgi:dephospho-CoA kinase